MNLTTRSSVQEHILFRVNNALLLYMPPVILAFGIVGNVLAFAVLTRRTMRGVSAYTYLTVLSVTDTLVLVIGLLRIWVNRLTNFDIRVLYPWVCKLLMMAGYTASDYSVWLIVAVTAERFVAVAWPLSALHGGVGGAGADVWRAVIVIVSLLAVLLAINGHFLWTVGITYVGGNTSFTNHTSQPKCTSLDGFTKLVALWPWVDAIIYSLLPLVALSVLNSLIICSVYRAKRRRCSLVATGSTKTASASAATDSPYRTIPATTGRGGGGGGATGVATAAGARDAERLTVMLLAVSFTFLITTLPSCVVLIIMSHHSSGRSLDTTLSVLVAQTVGELLMYANHSINFYLYCATGCKFRHQLVAMFRPSSSVSLTSSSRRHYKQQDSSVATKSFVLRSSTSAVNATRVQLCSDAALHTASASLCNGNGNTGAHQKSQLPNVRRHSNSDCKQLSTRDDATAEQTLLLLDASTK